MCQCSISALPFSTYMTKESPHKMTPGNWNGPDCKVDSPAAGSSKVAHCDCFKTLTYSLEVYDDCFVTHKLTLSESQLLMEDYL